MEEAGSIVHIWHILHILHIWHVQHIYHLWLFTCFAYNETRKSLHVDGAGHADRVIVFKAAAWYCLTEDELDEIFSCESEPMLKSYIHGVFRAAARLWKFVMPIDARSSFQTQVFHPAKVSAKLQSHLGTTTSQRIFDL